MTQFAELDDLLERFVAGVQAVLDDDLVGVYLTGSFALGGGDASSDCDFLVATARPLSAEKRKALRALHHEILDRPNGYWSFNLEGSYAPRADLETLDALGNEWLYVNRGRREPEWSTHCNREDVRWVLRHRSPTLVGTPPRAFAAEVPPDVLRATMRRGLATFVEDVRGWAPFDLIWTQRYLVESAARMLYTLDRAEVVTKRAALDWAESELPGEWHDLIRQVRDDRLLPWGTPAPPGSIERSVAFAEYARARAGEG